MRRQLGKHRRWGDSGAADLEQYRPQVFRHGVEHHLHHCLCRGDVVIQHPFLCHIRKFMEEHDEKKLRQYREYITRAF